MRPTCSRNLKLFQLAETHNYSELTTGNSYVEPILYFFADAVAAQVWLLERADCAIEQIYRWILQAEAVRIQARTYEVRLNTMHVRVINVRLQRGSTADQHQTCH
jgi:hypothetical protein